jgi:hypothetical protein
MFDPFLREGDSLWRVADDLIPKPGLSPAALFR